MALDTIVRGVTSGAGAEVSGGFLKVITETDAENNAANVGTVRFFSENDPGTITGEVYLKSPETSDDYRLRVGVDTLLLDHTFSETSLDTTKFEVNHSTNMVGSLNNGFLTLNSGLNSVSNGDVFSVGTIRHFKTRGAAPLYVEMTGNLSAPPIANQVIETGLFHFNHMDPGGQPQDGVWFQVTSAGIVGVLAYGGTITTTGILVDPANFPINVNGTYLITVGWGYVEFWIDNVLFGEIEVPTGQASPFLTDSLPVTLQIRNLGAVNASNQASLKMGHIVVSQGDLATHKPWSHQQAGMGSSGYQNQAGATMGSSAYLPNATSATAITGATLSQSASIATGLGGQAGLTAAVPGGDGMVFVYQNPAGNMPGQPSKNLNITGVKLSAVNMGAAVATTPTVIQWSLCFGQNNETLQPLSKVEVNNLSSTTEKSWRKIPLGFTSFMVGEPIGKQCPDLTVTFNSPVVVFPEEWVALVAKFISGTATVSQVIWVNALYDSYFD